MVLIVMKGVPILMKGEPIFMNDGTILVNYTIIFVQTPQKNLSVLIASNHSVDKKCGNTTS